MIAETNLNLFSDSEIVGQYSAKNSFVFGEARVFKDMEYRITGGDVLDIGVGGGRTTPFFLALKPRRYVGVDYAPNMVASCKELYPMTDFQEADVRNLAAFGNEEFDIVMFAWSGLDCISHEDRLVALKEVHRVLRPGGFFLFSSANARTPCGPPWDLEVLKDMDWRLRPRAVARCLLGFVKNLSNYMHFRRLQVKNADYLVGLDAAHSYRLLRYYIAPDKQVEQLHASAFTDIKLIDKKGNYRSADDCSLNDSPIYYIAERL